MELPPKRAIDHEIQLVPGSQPYAKSTYKMIVPEALELKNPKDTSLKVRVVDPPPSKIEQLSTCSFE